MDDDKVYNSYDFVQKTRKQTYSLLLIASGVIIAIILFFLGWGFLTSLDFWKGTTETISKPIDNPAADVDKRTQELKDAKTNYENAGIPYIEPSGKYSIEFMTPYPSNFIAVIFNVKDPDGSLKKDADARLSRAKLLVDISRVSYINNY